MFIYSALLTPSKWWSFSSFSATKHEMSFAQTSFWRVFWSLGYDEEKAVLEQWVASSSALLLREATKNAHEKIILHVSLAIRRLWTPAFLCSLSFKKWPGKSSNIFSPTFFGAKRQKSPMPFKAKKRLFSWLLCSPLFPSETPLTEVRIISSSVSSFSFGQGEKEIEEEEEAVAKSRLHSSRGWSLMNP